MGRPIIGDDEGKVYDEDLPKTLVRTVNGLSPDGTGNVNAAGTALVTSVAGKTGAVTLAKADVGLGNVDNTADTAKPVSTPQQVALNAKADLDGTGKVPQAQIPAIAVREFLGAVSTQAAMLTLTGQRGDWCTRTDRGTDFQVIAEPSSSVASWREQTYPASPVSSVNGRVGAVTTSTDDITDAGAPGKAVVKAADQAAARAALGAPASTDPRFSDTRTPTVGTVAADVSMIVAGKTTPRAVGTLDNPFGVKLQRAITVTKVTYRGLTADASGNLVVELRQNGATVAGSSATIAAANQVAGGSVTGTWNFAIDDIITVQVTAVGTTPGIGLAADLRALA